MGREGKAGPSFGQRDGDDDYGYGEGDRLGDVSVAADSRKPTLLAVCVGIDMVTLCTYRPTNSDTPENMWRNLYVLGHIKLKDARKTVFHTAMEEAAKNLGVELDYFELDPAVKLITDEHVHVVLEVVGHPHNRITLLPSDVGEMMEKAEWIDGHTGKLLKRTIHAERRGHDA